MLQLEFNKLQKNSIFYNFVYNFIGFPLSQTTFYSRDAAYVMVI